MPKEYTWGERTLARINSITRYLNPSNYFESICAYGDRDYRPRLDLTLEELRKEVKTKKQIAIKENERREYYRRPF
jgi:hypothetical protein